MPVPFADSTAGRGAAPAFLHLSLADFTAQQLSCLLAAPPSQLVVDCGRQLVPHPLGVCHFVAQLLRLRGRGTRLGLANVHPGVQHYLRQLELDDVLQLNPQA